MTPEAVAWHLNGEHGISSEAIFDRLTFGTTKDRRWGRNWPHDPDDFRRCEMLLLAVPEFRVRLGEMAGESPTWAALVERWDEVAALFEEECPGVFVRAGNRRADQTYAFMQSIIEPLRSRP